MAGVPPLADAERARRVAAFEAAGRNTMQAAKALGIPPSTLQATLRKTGHLKQIPSKGGKAIRAARVPAAARPSVRRWLLTAAQDDTPVDAGFWRNLNAYAGDLGAEIMVGGFTYQKGLYEDHASRTAAFAPEVAAHLRHDRPECGGLIFFADVNILPTAVTPLTGMTTMGRGQWAVFPHAKTQLESVPAPMSGQHPAMVMTTGAVTRPNYIQKKAGQKAEFHHTIGATIVEEDSAGTLFCRQIGAAGDGSFQDLDTVVRDGQVTRGHRVEAITWGDLHWPKLDPSVALAAFGFDVGLERVTTTDTMFHTLRPRFDFRHDLIDFASRNHHRRNDPHFAVKMATKGWRVEGEIAGAARFLAATQTDFCQTVVVRSNHDEALVRWLREADARADPVNFRYWCELNALMTAAIEREDEDFDIIAEALRRAVPNRLEGVVILPRDQSFITCPDRGGIENGLHGDKGPNGSRGGAASLIRVATRMNVGDAHSAGIRDQVFTAGLCGLFDQGYNSGPSSWSHTQIVTCANAKRTLVTMQNGKWRA